MYDCLPSVNLPPRCSFRIRNFGFSNSSKLHKYVKFSVLDSKWSSISTNATRFRDAIPYPSDEDLDFGLPEKEKDRLRRDRKGRNDESETAKSGVDEDLSIGDIFKFRDQKKDNELIKEDSNMGELERRGTINGAKIRRQMLRRSNIMAKQVISIQSALSLGFVSQLWVDTSSWGVIIVEVKPKLLSGDSDRFLLKEIRQVGDVILVQDENVIGDDLKLVGLETLVGYSVVTPRRRSIGKVSTYALFVDDVLEVFADTIVVRDAAVSRIQRLTKGFWGSQNAGKLNEFDERSDVDERKDYADYSGKQRRSRKPRPKKRKPVDDWELPMDFL
ncbi:hypothetical protein ACS0TY_015305 [Phlomoides rotata]